MERKIGPAWCLQCGKAVAEHSVWTQEDVDTSRMATYEKPLRLRCGTQVLGPVHPCVIGQFKGHDPMPGKAA